MKFAIALLLAANTFGVQAPDRYQDMTVVPIGPFVSSVTAPKGIVWKQEIKHPGDAAGIRVHIVVRKRVSSAEWAIRIRDLNGRHVDTFQGDSQLIAGGEIWSREIAGRGAIVELVADVEGLDPQIAVDRYAFRNAFRPETKSSGPPGSVLTPITAAPFDIQAWAEPVARLRFIEEGQQYTCTGFLVHQRLIMTASFCGKSASAMSMIADFGFDSDRAVPRSFRVKSIELTNDSLGYSLLRLADAPDGFRIATLAEGNVVVGQPVVVIQHPDGGPKQVSSECRVANANMTGTNPDITDFGYDCATSGGSSGSPVIARDSGRVLGVHRLRGRNASDLKQAIHAALILADLKRRAPALYEELMSPLPLFKK